MLNIAYTHGSVVLVVLHYYMLRNKQSQSHALHSMTSVVVLCAYRIKFNISKNERSYKNSTKEVKLLI